METPEYTDQLAAVNSKILAAGQSLPTVQLKDGSKVKTGTVATMLQNVTLYNTGQRGQIERELALSVPTFVKVGLFDLFDPDEWIAGKNPGRAFVGAEAKRYLAIKGSAG